jgi:hypothetical protein
MTTIWHSIDRTAIFTRSPPGRSSRCRWLAAPARLAGGRVPWRAPPVRSCGRGAGASAPSLERQQQRTFADLVANLDAERFDHAGCRRRHVHRRLVRLERNQRILDLDCVARFDQDLDHRHVGEVADVRNLDFDRAHCVPDRIRQQCVDTGAGNVVI